MPRSQGVVKKISSINCLRVCWKRVSRLPTMSADFSPSWRGATGQLDETLECVAQVADLLQMLAERMCLEAGADDEHVARIQPAIEPAVKQNAIDEAAQSPARWSPGRWFRARCRGECTRPDQVKRAGEEQAGGKAGLGAHPLLMEKVGHVHRRIKMQAPAGDNERKGESAQKRQQRSTSTGRETKCRAKSLVRPPSGVVRNL